MNKQQAIGEIYRTLGRLMQARYEYNKGLLSESQLAYYFDNVLAEDVEEAINLAIYYLTHEGEK